MDCLSYTWFFWDSSYQCDTCSIDKSGGYLECGKASYEGSVAWKIQYMLYFYQEGAIEVTYAKDTAKDEFFTNGQFSIFVDNIAYLEDVEVTVVEEWVSYKIDVTKGFHDIVLIYQKVNSQGDSSKDLSLKLKDLRISGINYASLDC